MFREGVNIVICHPFLHHVSIVVFICASYDASVSLRSDVVWVVMMPRPAGSVAGSASSVCVSGTLI